MGKKRTARKTVLLAMLVVVLTIGSTLTILYRNLLFRDYENFDLAGSDNSVSILFVGNSHVFWGRVPRQLHLISKEYGIEIAYKDISSNGAHLSRSKEEAISELQSGYYDYIILQDNTRLLPGGIDEFLDTIRLLCDAAKEHETIPVLFSPAVVDAGRQKVYTEAYLRASAENDALFVNAGKAWIYTYQTMPEVSLYAWDGVHANNAGAFLTSCVFAAILFELHIEEIPSNSLYNGNDALVLAHAAWDFTRL